MNDSNQNKSTVKPVLVYITILALILIGVAVYISIVYDASLVLNTIRGVKPIFLVCGVGMLFLQLYGEAFCIKKLFSLLKHKISLFSASGYAGTDLLYSNISPAQIAGLPAAAVSMYKDGIDGASSCTVLALYSMCNRIAGVLLAVFAVTVFPVIFGVGNALFLTLFVYGTITNFAIIGFFALALFMPSAARRLFPATVEVFRKVKFLRITEASVQKARRIAEDYINASKIIKQSPFTIFKILCVCILKRIANYSIAYFAYLSFGLFRESFLYIISLQSVLAIASESVPIPGSAGVAENVFTVLYSDVFGPRLYIPAMIVTRALNFFALLLVSGVYSMIQEFIRKRKR